MVMDQDLLLVFAFSLLSMGLLGVFVLLFPVSRRIGAYIEHRLSEPDKPAEIDRERVEFLQVLHRIESRMDSLSERQEFVEQLLDKSDSGRHAQIPTPSSES